MEADGEVEQQLRRFVDSLGDPVGDGQLPGKDHPCYPIALAVTKLALQRQVAPPDAYPPDLDPTVIHAFLGPLRLQGCGNFPGPATGHKKDVPGEDEFVLKYKRNVPTHLPGWPAGVQGTTYRFCLAVEVPPEPTAGAAPNVLNPCGYRVPFHYSESKKLKAGILEAACVLYVHVPGYSVKARRPKNGDAVAGVAGSANTAVVDMQQTPPASMAPGQLPFTQQPDPELYGAAGTSGPTARYSQRHLHPGQPQLSSAVAVPGAPGMLPGAVGTASHLQPAVGPAGWRQASAAPSGQPPHWLQTAAAAAGAQHYGIGIGSAAGTSAAAAAGPLPGCTNSGEALLLSRMTVMRLAVEALVAGRMPFAAVMQALTQWQFWRQGSCEINEWLTSLFHVLAMCHAEGQQIKCAAPWCLPGKLYVTAEGAAQCGAIAWQLLNAIRDTSHRREAIVRVNNNRSSPLTMAARFGNRTFIGAWLQRPEVRLDDVIHTTNTGRTAIHLACQPPPRSGQVAEHYVSSPLGMLLAALDGLVKKHNADYPNDRKKMADLVKHPPGYPDAGRHYDEDQLWPMCLVRYGFDPAEWWR